MTRHLIARFSIALAALVFVFAGVAAAGNRNPWWTSTYNPAATQVGKIRWNTSNLGTLRAFNKEAIIRFFNEAGGFDSFPGRGIDPSSIWEFKWIDLAGDGEVELVTIGSSGPCCVALGIDRQDAVGKVSTLGFDGAGTIKNTVRDLNGDGKYELILYTYLKTDGYDGTTPVAMWPRVYRLKKGDYVNHIQGGNEVLPWNYLPASRDFPKFYEDEVLPQLDKQMEKARQMAWPPGSPTGSLEVLEMERDKILRVLGRDPGAGLKLARQWATSSDPETVRRAAVVFADIGGHEDEYRAAIAAYKRALAHQSRP